MFSEEAIPFEGTSGKEVEQNFDFYLSFLFWALCIRERDGEKREPRHRYSFERVCSLFFFLFPLC